MPVPHFIPIKKVRGTEKLVASLFRNRGVSVLRNGWPDFAIVKNGTIASFVEVKQTGERLTPEQNRMCRFLVELGIPVFIWTPARGFERFDASDSIDKRYGAIKLEFDGGMTSAEKTIKLLRDGIQPSLVAAALKLAPKGMGLISHN